jgi:RNase H-fold protein (predicted Holliday junction resolvase)
MRNQLKKLKRVNPLARILGMDIGRKYIGLSVSDKLITQSRVSELLSI